ncbi:MAG: class I SAM-dependent methyltransferase [Streptosporangiaceae bacterium]
MTTTRRDRHHDARLRRGRRLWNFLGRVVPAALGERGAAPVHELMFEHLNLRAGQSVLDIGCGAGGTLIELRGAVGAEGRLVGVDYSERMLADAKARVAERGWTNVELRRADATRESLGDAEFDVAVALSSFSAMPDVAAAVDHAWDALRPGGQLFVFDMRLVCTGAAWLRATTRLLRLVYRALAGFTGEDVVAELERKFEAVQAVLPYATTGDLIALAVATKAGGPAADPATPSASPGRQPAAR